jgi:hypothetical protein
MNTLYLLGGAPRTAKTTIMSGLAKEKGIAFIAADAVEHGLRNVLTGEPHQMLRDIELTGSAGWKTSITEGGQRKPFSNKGTESELTLQAVVGMLDYYRRNNESVAFEGAAFTPEWAKNLKVADVTIRAAFVGFTDPTHVDQILAFAKANSHDWINVWLENDGGDETKIREWVTRQAEKCVELKLEAEQLGFPFFDISTMPFDEYVAAAQQYLLGS